MIGIAESRLIQATSPDTVEDVVLAGSSDHVSEAPAPGCVPDGAAEGAEEKKERNGDAAARAVVFLPAPAPALAASPAASPPAAASDPPPPAPDGEGGLLRPVAVQIEPLGGDPFTVSVAVDSTIFQVKKAIRKLKGHTIASMCLLQEGAEVPCPHRKPISECFATEPRSLALQIADCGEIGVLVDLQAHCCPIGDDQGIVLDNEMDLDEVMALRLTRLKIVDYTLVGLDLRSCRMVISLPDTIGNPESLQNLDLGGCACLEGIR